MQREERPESKSGSRTLLPRLFIHRSHEEPNVPYTDRPAISSPVFTPGVRPPPHILERVSRSLHRKRQTSSNRSNLSYSPSIYPEDQPEYLPSPESRKKLTPKGLFAQPRAINTENQAQRHHSPSRIFERPIVSRLPPLAGKKSPTMPTLSYTDGTRREHQENHRGGMPTSVQWIIVVILTGLSVLGLLGFLDIHPPAKEKLPLTTETASVSTSILLETATSKTTKDTSSETTHVNYTSPSTSTTTTTKKSESKSISTSVAPSKSTPHPTSTTSQEHSSKALPVHVRATQTADSLSINVRDVEDQIQQRDRYSEEEPSIIVPETSSTVPPFIKTSALSISSPDSPHDITNSPPPSLTPLTTTSPPNHARDFPLSIKNPLTHFPTPNLPSALISSLHSKATSLIPKPNLDLTVRIPFARVTDIPDLHLPPAMTTRPPPNFDIPSTSAGASTAISPCLWVLIAIYGAVLLALIAILSYAAHIVFKYKKSIDDIVNTGREAKAYVEKMMREGKDVLVKGFDGLQQKLVDKLASGLKGIPGVKFDFGDFKPNAVRAVEGVGDADGVEEVRTHCESLTGGVAPTPIRDSRFMYKRVTSASIINHHGHTTPMCKNLLSATPTPTSTNTVTVLAEPVLQAGAAFSTSPFPFPLPLILAFVVLFHSLFGRF
ncbi:hypothetical protein BU24DRAFT_425611 [Aaosphaeria arxii CBS 175.79]|uniref:Uncharacterized protein n=1 Tax=Aaosphaeria arxii CBS 175.79 TaxID=1450172 RepID=A0A6A5XIG9_9PLEO|nr:uncharacterized protein BU24DRAFT_425611 [Aaosphaeria arxii CBS 175.79]KAF2013048.1 hypothetical protein BU24DRAFT_425611 [Aaosphaeria arxii CBS 175.79]